MSKDNFLIKEINYLTNLINNHKQRQSDNWRPQRQQFWGACKPWRPPQQQPPPSFYRRPPPSYPPQSSSTRFKYVASSAAAGSSSLQTKPPLPPSPRGPKNIYKLNRIGAMKLASNREKLKINNFRMRLVKLKGKIYRVGIKKAEGVEKQVVSLKKPSRNISLANRMVARSRQLLAAKRKKVNENCMFFVRYGRCSRGQACPYLHQQDRAAGRLPTCSFFLRGRCNADSCPFPHVSVDPSAPLCPRFLKGYCPLADKCTKRHVLPKRKLKTVWKPSSKRLPANTISKSKEADSSAHKSPAVFPASLPSFIPLAPSPCLTPKKESSKSGGGSPLKIRPSFILPPPEKS